MTPAERNAKRINREIKLNARLDANATRIHPPTDRETRQQVRHDNPNRGFKKSGRAA